MNLVKDPDPEVVPHTWTYDEAIKDLNDIHLAHQRLHFALCRTDERGRKQGFTASCLRESRALSLAFWASQNFSLLAGEFETKEDARSAIYRMFPAYKR